MEAFNIAKRSSKLTFYKLPDAEEFVRMQGFKTMETSKNPEEYERKYVDEDAKRTDVIAYNTSVSYEMDYIIGNEVHEDIADITDNERVGVDAVREILIVDVNTKTAIKRSFAVIPDSEGGDENTYTYSGTFKANGDRVQGTAEISADGLTATFTAAAAAQ